MDKGKVRGGGGSRYLPQSCSILTLTASNALSSWMSRSSDSSQGATMFNTSEMFSKTVSSFAAAFFWTVKFLMENLKFQDPCFLNSSTHQSVNSPKYERVFKNTRVFQPPVTRHLELVYESTITRMMSSTMPRPNLLWMSTWSFSRLRSRSSPWEQIWWCVDQDLPELDVQPVATLRMDWLSGRQTCPNGGSMHARTFQKFCPSTNWHIVGGQRSFVQFFSFISQIVNMTRPVYSESRRRFIMSEACRNPLRRNYPQFWMYLAVYDFHCVESPFFCVQQLVERSGVAELPLDIFHSNSSDLQSNPNPDCMLFVAYNRISEFLFSHCKQHCSKDMPEISNLCKSPSHTYNFVGKLQFFSPVLLLHFSPVGFQSGCGRCFRISCKMWFDRCAWIPQIGAIICQKTSHN